MKWNYILIILLTIACCWLLFRPQDNSEQDTLNRQLDSLDRIVKSQANTIDSANKLSAFWEGVADSNSLVISKQINYSLTLKNRLNAVTTNIDDLDSSEAFSELSNWLIRETGESLIKGR